MDDLCICLEACGINVDTVGVSPDGNVDHSWEAVVLHFPNGPEDVVLMPESNQAGVHTWLTATSGDDDDLGEEE